jgi:hypothetical protein
VNGQDVVPYEVSWYQKQRVIYWRVWGQSTLEEIAQMGKGQQKLVNEGTVPVHLIANVTDVENFPTDLRQLKVALDGINHPHLGWTLIVGTTTPLKRFVTTTVIQMVIPGVRLRMFNTLDEAVEFLKYVDDTIAMVPL